ncbi:LacI family transcriptional regulator [Brucepastera parasyntrophica]|uniref:LacI family DNA-binding transcriptional regulator n=1 Tax=Brucepastera parasyntrophica TaxID=2880008 RepID=UPI00210CE529|nr:LacI family DNA-binding transcriptional regulator [Brucepastera parasyntrophica]ULQ60827.1 LacI family transcriptional regulator [Brucepastera parasyntrophica]
MRSTINDIALRAGVSKATVSFAFNNPSKISKDTYTRIMEIAGELGYVPDPVARTLAKKHTGSIGFLVPQAVHEVLQNPYISEIIRGIGYVCDNEGLSLSILSPLKGVLSQTIRNAAVDGLVTLGIGPGMSILELFYQRGLPFVTIDGKSDKMLVNIGIDDSAAAENLMDTVLAYGHRKIAIYVLKDVLLPDDADFSSIVNECRLEGFRRSLAKKGIPLEKNSDIQIFYTDSSMEDARDITHDLLALKNSPSVIICFADIQTFGVYEECKRQGFVIPDTISVISFDDIPFARFMSPPLTTVRQPGFLKGQVAAEVLMDMLAKRTVSSIVMDTELIIRSSLASV